MHYDVIALPIKRCRMYGCMSILILKPNKTSNLSTAHETRDSFSSSYSQIVLIYLYPFRRNSLLKSTPQPQIARKNTKTPILEFEDHLTSLAV